LTGALQFRRDAHKERVLPARARLAAANPGGKAG
jgi:hypothetical protein